MTQRMTAAQFRSRKPEGSNKYNAQRVCVQGINFDSKREANRYLVLRQMLAAGEIAALRLQVKVPLFGRDGPLLTRTGKHMRITVDFSYIVTATGATIYEDAKGKPTRDYEVRRAVAAAQGIKVVEV